MNPGAVLADRFEVLGRLGRGASATVLLVHDRLRDERRALKVLHPHLAGDPRSQERLRRELAAASRVRCPSALVPDDLVLVDGVPALVMPFHPGRSLAEHVASRGPLPGPELEELARRLAEALAAAHRAGVVHRDVTPANVLLDLPGDAALTDFGLARLRDGATRATSALGTTGYAAPEVLGGARDDPRSDLYALGATLYLAATGAPPFVASTPMAALAAQLAGPPPSVATRAPGLPGHLVTLIDALVRPDPDARPPSASVVLDALQLRAPLPSPARPRTVEPVASIVGPPAPAPGGWGVVVRGSLRRRRRGVAWDARVAAAVEEALGPGARRRRLGRRGWVIRRVDEATARRLRTALRRHGVRANVRGDPRETPWLAVAALVLLLAVPGLAAVPAVLLGLLEPVLPSLVILAAVGVLVGVTGRRAAVMGPTRVPAQPSPAVAGAAVALEAPAAPRTDAARRRAEAELDALLRAIDADPTLPEQAAADLRSTVRRLGEEVVELVRLGSGAERSLAQEAGAEPDWLHERLERLTTLERAGSPVDPAERRRVEAALTAAREADAARDQLEGRLTTHLAGLLEVAGGALQARLALLSGPGPERAPALGKSLGQQVAAVHRAGREVG